MLLGMTYTFWFYLNLACGFIGIAFHPYLAILGFVCAAFAYWYRQKVQVSCDGCGKWVSKKAKVCPSCGHPLDITPST